MSANVTHVVKRRNRLNAGGAFAYAVQPQYAWDFLTNQARFNSIDVGSLANTPGWTFSRASTGYAQTSAGALTAFASGELRRTDKGVLIEGARTNLVTYSQDWTDSSWTKSNATVTAAAATAPDGTTTATQLSATTSAVTTVVKNAGAVAATAASYSIFVKKGSGATDANAFILRNLTTATILVNGTINYDTGAWTTTTGNAALVSTLGNGWYRITLYATSGITSGDSLQVYVGFTGNSETANEFAYVWGAQLEAASFPSSYIPTTTASATRAADALSVPVTLASPLTMHVEFEYSGADSSFGLSNRYAFQVGLNNTNRAILYNAGTNGANRCIVQISAATQANPNVGTSIIPVGVPQKVALAVATNDFRIVSNGTLGTPDTSGTALSDITIAKLGGEPTSELFGYLRRVAIFSRALSDGELQSVTQ